jgi:predicted lipoprotein
MYAGSDTVCSATSAAGTGWAALSTDERAARKRAYAAAVARDIAKRAAALDDAWDPTKGNFSQTLRTAGSGNATYPMTQDALNSVSDAVFYVEIKVKDAKLAVPAGIDMDACPSTTCPDELESKFGGLSKTNVRANLRGARQLLEGCGPDYAGPGFDDLLEAVGAGAVAALLRERVAAAQAALEAIEEPDLREALAADRDSVLALYQALKGITDVLKSDFATILDLRLPAESMGDND